MPHSAERCDEVIALNGRMDRAEEDIAGYAPRAQYPARARRRIEGRRRSPENTRRLVRGGNAQLIQALSSLITGSRV